MLSVGAWEEFRLYRGEFSKNTSEIIYFDTQIKAELKQKLQSKEYFYELVVKGVFFNCDESQGMKSAQEWSWYNLFKKKKFHAIVCVMV